MARPGAHRKFYDFTNCPADQGDTDGTQGKEPRPQELVEYVAQSIIGANTVFSSPFGPRKVVYCDYIASGRSVRFLEEYITEEVLPHYGSTHTTSTLTALQTTLFRHEARDIVRNSVRASEHDRVVFVGSGATGALHKLIHAVGLGVRTRGVPTVVFVDPHAHHSSLLPWREAGAKVIRIRESWHGGIDRDHLEACLKCESGRGARLVGCLAAASNVSGAVADDVGLTVLLHRYGALAFWDYATAAPYVAIRMNPVVEGDSAGLAYKDAIYFSVHKFIGGVQTPGVLVAKREVFESQVPEVCGGGTVFFVSRESHRYLQDVEMREEGGTPAIVESVRAGMVLQLKDAITPGYITARNALLSRRLSEFIKSVPELENLGNVEVCCGCTQGGCDDKDSSCGDCNFVNAGTESNGGCHDSVNCGGNCSRLPILSFLVRHPTTKLFLHYNFVCAVLNDVYGIQARGGCACAGPYVQDLMGLSEVDAQRYERRLAEDPRLDRSHLRRRNENSDLEVLRPGFTRLNIPYTASEGQIEFILKAVHEVCCHAWKLLPQYILNPETGEWKHHTNTIYRGRLWLQKVSYANGKFFYSKREEAQDAPDYVQCLEEAQLLFSEAPKAAQRRMLADNTILFQDEAANLRWFLLPSEARALLLSPSSPSAPLVPSLNTYPKPPFSPVKYPLSDSELSSRIDYVWEPAGDNMTLGVETTVGTAYRSGPKSDNTDVEDYTSLSGNLYTDTNCPEKLERSINSSNGVGSTKLRKNDRSNVREQIVNKDVDIFHMNSNTVSGKKSPVSSKERVEGTTERNEFSSIENSKMVRNVEKSDEGGQEEPALSTLEKATELSIGTQTKNSSKKKQKIVCEDMTCFVKREDGKDSSIGDGASNDISIIKKWHAPPKNIFNPTLEAITDFSMIHDGDRVLVCLSGGKDSLSLLHTLRQYQHYARGTHGVSFTLGAATVDPLSAAYDPRPLIPYLASLGVPYLFERQDILQQAAQLENLASICSFCSRMKRGRLYAAARRSDYNVLAMGQHLDDLAESFLMSVFHNGRLRTMKANYTVKEGDLRVIRPFVYVREKDLRVFAESRKLPVIPENCPACFEAPKERHRVKQVLAQQEVLFPQLYWSLRSALRPVMAVPRTGLESVIFGRNGALATVTAHQGVNDDEEEREHNTSEVEAILGPLANLMKSEYRTANSHSSQLP
ncbi:hypothetical protein Pcinc_020802 [Petrolisthes cinctipes]|uniref:Uncharacterized protein n=1 Tax=Petrolisthes cinctipes TaxID=88211 RepID=A0AAE1FIF2_PETCI|nr:hypothetical protein Pcinc_020802 [Petrolisthes cinctipes]